MKIVFGVTQPFSKGACAKAGSGTSVLLKAAGYRDAQKGIEQVGSAGNQQDGHRQVQVVPSWLCFAMPTCWSIKECLNGTLHSLTGESSHTFTWSDQKKKKKQL